jgi:hypothetical protein
MSILTKRLRPIASAYPPVYHAVDTRTGIHILREPYRIACPLTGTLLAAPAGFQWDGASVPRAAHAFVPPFSLSIVAALFHDLLYRYGGVLPAEYCEPHRTYTRAEADEQMRLIMLLEGVAGWRRRGAYTAIRAAGGHAWGKMTPPSIWLRPDLAAELEGVI